MSNYQIEIRQLSGKYKLLPPIYTSKIKADIALRKAIFKEYGRIWLTPTGGGTSLHSSIHGIVLGRLHPVDDAFSEEAVNRELRRRLKEFHETDSG